MMSSIPTGNPLGNIYYNQSKLLDFTIKRNSTSIVLNISKTTIYEGEFAEIIAYVTSNGNPIIFGYLEWIYDGGSVTTLANNGVDNSLMFMS